MNFMNFQSLLDRDLLIKVSSFVVLTIVFYVVLRFLIHNLVRRARKIGAFSALNFSEIVLKTLQSTKKNTLLILSVCVSGQLNLAGSVPISFQKILVLTLVVQGFFWANIFVKTLLSVNQDHASPFLSSKSSIHSITNLVLRLFLYSALIITALDQVGINVTTLVAGLGVGGVAVALAVQNILGDLFASLTIALDRPFEPGDFIVVGEQKGEVEKIGLKTTKVRSLSGEQLIFSNMDLLQSRIQNFKRMQERRVVFKIGVLYETPAEKLAKIPEKIKKIISGVEQTRFDRSHFAGFGDSSLDFETVYWVKSPDYGKYMDIQQEINLVLFRELKADGVDFAYPTRTLYMKSQ